MIIRPRRLRNDANIRGLSRETRLSPKSLILPLFIKEGQNIKEPINSLDGHFYYSPDTVSEAIEQAFSKKIKSVLLFGLPEVKDEIGSGAYANDGVIQKAIG